MNFTDLFIKRPVLATVVSLLILFLGLRALHDLPVRQYPRLENTVITVTTIYPGASPEVMQGFIAIPLQRAIASADGIDYLTSQSTQGSNIIKAYIKLNYDSNTAFTDIMSKVASVRSKLPRDIEDPSLTKDTGSTIALMYIGFSSPQMSAGQITDYLTRVVVPKIQTVPGLSQANILGGRTFAMRIWLDPQKMAGFNITPTDVQNAITNNNYQSAPGATKGEFVAFNMYADTDLHDPKQFEQIVVKNDNGVLIKMKDIGHVELGAQDYDSIVTYNGQQAVFLGITATPTANPLTVINDVRNLLPQLQKGFPAGLTATIAHDSTKYIRAALYEVVKTIIEATIIVVVVIFLFLGSLRSVLIPVVTIPLSLIGVCTFMLFLGYSINLLTLLAMVLAIGLVVDDAIVVVENIHRHIEEGMMPFAAAIQGAREIATPVIAMTITLAAVYAPIGFLGGITGTLFKEFAFTLASTVIISGIIALTLSPMMCSKILRQHEKKIRFEAYLETKFTQLKDLYERRLHGALDYRPVTVMLAVIVLVSCYFLFMGITKELAPEEDQGVLFVEGTAPEYANIDYVHKFAQQYINIFRKLPETESYFVISNTQTINAGDILKPWEERSRSQKEINQILQQQLNSVAGLQTAVFPLPTLPVGDQGLPVAFVINGTNDFQSLYNVSQQVLKAAQESGLFMYVESTLKYSKPELEVHIDRDKAGQLGLTMQDIGNALATAYGGNYTNLFSVQGQSYQVIPQVMRYFRLNPENIENIYITTPAGKKIPLSTVIDYNITPEPNTLSQFQQLNSATIQGLMIPSKTIGDGLTFLKNQADKILPAGFSYDYSGQSRQFIQEGTALVFAFFFALIVIFLVLAAQFESFRDPFIILISVPMSICGALIPLYLGAATINIYTQVGLITLIGLISKHGILMTDFANKLQIHEKLSVREAIEKAASIRLRPILMTTGAMVMGVVPLIFATGAGAVSRYNIGLVIGTGMLIGTLFTLFVVPTMYTFLAKDHAKAVANENKIELDAKTE